MESDNSSDVPLDVAQNLIANQLQQSLSSDDEDDVPLSIQAPTYSRLKKRRASHPPPVDQPSSDSDDDIPLVTKLKKPSKPTRRTTSQKATQRRTTTSRKTSDKKDKKPVKRAPRVKKEEDVPNRKYEKLGQRKETPPENDPTRLFYQSMYREKVALGKKSFTAESWMLRNGLLDKKEITQVMARWDLKK